MLSTYITLESEAIVRIYGMRWVIEVFLKGNKFFGIYANVFKVILKMVNYPHSDCFYSLYSHCLADEKRRRFKDYRESFLSPLQRCKGHGLHGSFTIID